MLCAFTLREARLASGALDETQQTALQALRIAILALDIEGASGDENIGSSAKVV
jgi:hypothetical protein